MRTCTLPGCTRKHFARGLCKTDYRRKERAGELHQHPRTQVVQPVGEDGRRTCTEPGCDRDHYAHGRCRSHRQRFLRTGDARPGVPIARMWFGQYNRGRSKPAPEPVLGVRRGIDLIDTEEL